MLAAEEEEHAAALIDGFGTLIPSPSDIMGNADTYAAAVRHATLNFNASSPGKGDNFEPFYPACPIYDAANTAGGTANACRFMRFMKDRACSRACVLACPTEADVLYIFNLFVRAFSKQAGACATIFVRACLDSSTTTTKPLPTVLVAAPAVFKHPLAGPFPPSPFDPGFVPPPFQLDLRGQVRKRRCCHE